MLRRNRTWVILALVTGEVNVWEQFTAVLAPTRKAAINLATAGHGNQYGSGTFRAVDARHWGAAVEKVADWPGYEC